LRPALADPKGRLGDKRDTILLRLARPVCKLLTLRAPKPEEPELNSLRREGATPTQTGSACLNVQESRPRGEGL